MAKIGYIKYVRIYIILLHVLLMSQNSIGQLIRQQQRQPSGENLSGQSKISLLNDFSSNRQSINSKQQLKVKALQTAVAGVNQQPSTSITAVAAARALGNGLPGIDDQYKCAKHCSCSVIQVLERVKGQIRANLTQAKCESSLFSDVLTIDRRTQIIHISLPISDLKKTTLQNVDTFSAKTNNDQIIKNNLQSFRMPRLVQFNILKEIIIINLRFEVCDSEVFKRGQSLRRFKLNYNQLTRISKACLKHLEKLVELNLDHNNLEELESALFSSLLSLKSLSIAHNKLSELAAHQFVNLTNLISLNLVGNSFKTINLHLFEPMQNNLRLLLLAKNEIKLFLYSPIQQQQQQQQQNQTPTPNSSTNQTTKVAQNWSSPLQLPLKLPLLTATKSSALLSGVVFKNLLKLNVDHNKLERIKQLQLHRFFNIKYLSIRHNNIATIRDKAFNGLKLIELNLAHNQLASISKCAFCNATIKRLVLSHNNITLPLPNQMLLEPPTSVLSSSSSIAAAAASAALLSEIPRPLASVATNETYLPEPLAQKSSFSLPDQPSNNIAPSASSSQNMLILSQSIFGPLFGQLEYLDLSNNEMLANQLDFLLEPLLKLEYLNIAAVGIDRSLTSPTLFKNLRQLKYLNISNNQLDMLVSETVEPLTMLEVLDMSNNKFSELDESFLVTIDELSSLKVVNFGLNPWFCSQCKVAPLYDWISRSQIYNYTCIAPLFELQQDENNSNNEMDTSSLIGDNLDNQATINEQSRLNSKNHIYKSVHDYNILLSDEVADELETSIDFDSVLSPSLDDDSMSNYNFLDLSLSLNSGQSLMRSDLLTTTGEDDPSIAQTIAKTSMIINANSLSKRFNPNDYCLGCEFPRELHKFKIHELNPGDFKFCADGAPRFAASEPRIGLTLAIVIIGALFLIIIVVIVMYRRKSNTYYTNEDTDTLNGAKKPVLSISSDVEHQYGGDGTDYSSPPMSQSYDSYSQDDDDGEDEDEDEEIGDEDEEEEEYDEEDDDNGGEGGEEEVDDELDEESGEASKERKENENRQQPDEATRFSLGSSKSEDQHHKQTSEHNHRKQIRQASLIGSPNELRPSSALTLSSEQTTKGIHDKSQSSIQSNSASKRVQQVAIEKASWGPNSASNSLNLTGGVIHSPENSGKSENLVEKVSAAENVARKSAASRQSSGGKVSKINKFLSNQSAESQSTYSNGRQQKQKQKQKHQQKTRETDLAQEFKETQSGSLSLAKRYSNKTTTPSDSLDRETRESRDSWPTSRANNDHPVEEIISPDVNVVARLRAKRNSGSIYQVATSLKPLNLSSSKSSNRSSNGTGSAATYSSHLADGHNNTNESNNPSKNKSLQVGNHSTKRLSDSQAGSNRQHTTTGATPPRTMSRQRFAAMSNDLADLTREETLANIPIREMSMITPKQAEHLVREANAFQQINPADESSISSLPPPLAPASDFMQALQGSETLKGAKNFTNRNEINQHYGMAHQERVQSPSPASDATTADSLAMEALEYLANELDDNEPLSAHQATSSAGVAGASATSNKEFLALDETGGALAEFDASSLEYDAHMMQHLTAPGTSNGKGLKKLRESHSTHSVLTQTGSRELGNI